MSAEIDIALAEENFLRQGGIYAAAIRSKRKSGELSGEYVFREYPKMIRLSKGSKKIDRTTETVDKKQIKWTEEIEDFNEILVHSEDEEERVLSGGKSSVEIEDERQVLMHRARRQGVNVDPSWSIIRLKRLLNEALDAPPEDELSRLQREVSRLEEITRMKDRLKELQRQADDTSGAMLGGAALDDLRARVRNMGGEPDGRWGEKRLQDEIARLSARQVPPGLPNPLSV